MLVRCWSFLVLSPFSLGFWWFPAGSGEIRSRLAVFLWFSAVSGRLGRCSADFGRFTWFSAVSGPAPAESFFSGGGRAWMPAAPQGRANVHGE